MYLVVASYMVVAFLVTLPSAFAAIGEAPSPAPSSAPLIAHRRCQALLGRELPKLKGTFHDVWLLPVTLDGATDATILLRWRPERTAGQLRLNLGLASDLNVRAARYVIPLTLNQKDGTYYTILTGSMDQIRREVDHLIDLHGDRNIFYSLLRHEGRLNPVGAVPTPRLVFALDTLTEDLAKADHERIAREGLVIYAPDQGDIYFLLPNEVSDRIPALMLSVMRTQLVVRDSPLDLNATLTDPPRGKYVIRSPDFTLVSAGTIQTINRYVARQSNQRAVTLAPDFETALTAAQAEVYAEVPVTPR